MPKPSAISLVVMDTVCTPSKNVPSAPKPIPFQQLRDTVLGIFFPSRFLFLLFLLFFSQSYQVFIPTTMEATNILHVPKSCGWSSAPMRITLYPYSTVCISSPCKATFTWLPGHCIFFSVSFVNSSSSLHHHLPIIIIIIVFVARSHIAQAAIKYTV